MEWLLAICPDTVEEPRGQCIWIRTNSIGWYSGYLSGYISRKNSIQIRTSGTTEMNELAVGRTGGWILKVY